MPTLPFTLRPVILIIRGRRYDRFQVSGWINDRRIRKTAHTQAEAEGLKLRLEAAAASSFREPKRILTRLTEAEVIAAEIAVGRLGAVPLTTAAEFYLTNYRPPSVPMPLPQAVAAFLADREPHVSPFVLTGYRRRLEALCEAFPCLNVSAVTTDGLRAYMSARWQEKKTWNLRRGEFSCFFNWCRAEPRQWSASNPVALIPKFKIPRGLPEILSAAQVSEFFAYLENYRAGALVPYFALATFAGLRPSTDGGELWRLGQLKYVSSVIDLEVGAIRISPETSKTNDCRTVKIQPNLRAWLERYPLGRFPIIPPDARDLIHHLRKKFALSHDVLRHTYISMHVAKFRSMGDTALQAGNSEAIIRKHYLNAVSEADAEAFWSIMPARSMACADSAAA